jgi:hypothetical protein
MTMPVRVLLAIAFATIACGQERVPRIDVVHIQPALIRADGTASAFEVTYTIEFVPANATSVDLEYIRNGEVVKTFPAPMQAGTNKIAIPSGLPMDNPQDFLRVQVELPDGKLSEPATLMIYDAEDFKKRDNEARARFTRLEPDLVTATPATPFLTIVGTDLGVVSELTIDRHDVDAKLVDGALRVALPADLFEMPGFVVVEPRSWHLGQTLTLAVADPALPPLGGLTGVRITRMEYMGSGSNDTVFVHGEGFERGMAVVIGRGKTPIRSFETDTGRDASELMGSVDFGAPADDYFLAILSTDKKRLSGAFAIASPEKLRAGSGYRAPGDAAPGPNRDGFRVHGDLAWNPKTPQWFYLEGPIARPGLRVRLDRQTEPVVVEAAADAAASPAQAKPGVRVTVPASLLQRATYDVRMVMHTK